MTLVDRVFREMLAEEDLKFLFALSGPDRTAPGVLHARIRAIFAIRGNLLLDVITDNVRRRLAGSYRVYPG